ncbi:MAG: lasso peptide biosynthesis B2 protein [Steroidobacteraceae bacterium]
MKATRYRAIPNLQAQVLARHVKGWPQEFRDGHSPLRADPVPQDIQDKILDQLRSRNIITVDPSAGKLATPVSCERPQGALTHEDLHSKPKISWSDMRRFYRAMSSSKRLLRENSLHSIVECIRERRLRALATPVCHIERARELVLAFRHLLPLIFNGPNECLPHSIALIEYLIPDGFLPRLVFGVHTRPFKAHCYLRSGSLVWGDIPDYVGAYTPIAEF